VNGDYKYLDHGGKGDGEYVRQDSEGYVYNIQKNTSAWYINRCNREGLIVMYTSKDSGTSERLPPTEGWRFAEAAKLPVPTVRCVPVTEPETLVAPAAATATAKGVSPKTKADLAASSPKWFELRDPEIGRTSYLNLDTGESVFTKPEDFDPALQKQWEGQVKQQSAQESGAKGATDLLSNLRKKGESLICAACGNIIPVESVKRCARCRVVNYCNRNCQKAHWKAHKSKCKQIQKDQK
jgi:hypothetical protein